MNFKLMCNNKCNHQYGDCSPLRYTFLDVELLERVDTYKCHYDSDHYLISHLHYNILRFLLRFFTISNCILKVHIIIFEPTMKKNKKQWWLINFYWLRNFELLSLLLAFSILELKSVTREGENMKHVQTKDGIKFEISVGISQHKKFLNI